MIVGERGHLKFEFSAAQDLVVGDEDFVIGRAIQCRAINVIFLRAVIPGNDGKRFAIPNLEGGLVEQRTAE